MMKSNTTYVTYCKSYPINYPHNGKFRNPESKLIVYSDKFLLSEIFRSIDMTRQLLFLLMVFQGFGGTREHGHFELDNRRTKI